MNIEMNNISINRRIILASLWISHFLLWSFGDILSLLQQMNEPVDNGLLLFVAVPLAIIQVSMLLLTLILTKKIVLMLNTIVPLIFLVFNIGFLTEAQYGWEYLIGSIYIIINIITIITSWKWKSTKV